VNIQAIIEIYFYSVYYSDIGRSGMRVEVTNIPVWLHSLLLEWGKCIISSVTFYNLYVRAVYVEVSVRVRAKSKESAIPPVSLGRNA
jgi:hypothetical protein